MTKKKTKKQLLEESLSEAINPRPKNDRLSTVQSLLENYREPDAPSTPKTQLPSTDSDFVPSAISKIEPSTDFTGGRHEIPESAVHINTTGTSTVVSFDRPPSKEQPSTNSKPAVLPSTTEILPSTKKVAASESAVIPSTPKKTAVHKSEKAPSSSDRHNDAKIGRFDNRIRKSVIKRIKEFCLKTELSQKDFVEMSAVHFIETWTANNLKNVDGKTSHDDGLKMMVYKTAPRIINLYRVYNAENKWKYRDDEVGSKYNSVDLKILELGIIQTQFNANFKKINSFEYYTNEIDKYVEQKLAGEMLDFLLDHYRKKWTGQSGREIDFSFLENGK